MGRRSLQRALCVGVLGWLALIRTAVAAPARVALVREREPSALAQRTLTRLRAELIAAGFEVTEIERHGEDAREAAEAEPAAGVFATIVIVPRTGDAADIWVADRITEKTVVRRVEGAGGSGRDVATVLAVRAVELLQASLLEALERPSSVASAAPPAPGPVVPSEVSAWMQARHAANESAASEAHFGLQGGAAVIHSFSGVGPAVLPVLGLVYHLSTDVAFGIRAGGPAFAADLRATGGTIAVRQQLVNLDIIYALLSPGAAVRPVVMGSVGAYHLDVVGAAAPPDRGESDGVWAALFGLGAGAKLRLGARVSLLGDLRLFFLAPQPIVRAAGAEVGRMSRPSMFGEVAIDVAF